MKNKKVKRYYNPSSDPQPRKIVQPTGSAKVVKMSRQIRRQQARKGR